MVAAGIVLEHVLVRFCWDQVAELARGHFAHLDEAIAVLLQTGLHGERCCHLVRAALNLVAVY